MLDKGTDEYIYKLEQEIVALNGSLLTAMQTILRVTNHKNEWHEEENNATRIEIANLNERLTRAEALLRESQESMSLADTEEWDSAVDSFLADPHAGEDAATQEVVGRVTL